MQHRGSVGDYLGKSVMTRDCCIPNTPLSLWKVFKIQNPESKSVSMGIHCCVTLCPLDGAVLQCRHSSAPFRKKCPLFTNNSVHSQVVSVSHWLPSALCGGGISSLSMHPCSTIYLSTNPRKWLSLDGRKQQEGCEPPWKSPLTSGLFEVKTRIHQ